MSEGMKYIIVMAIFLVVTTMLAPWLGLFFLAIGIIVGAIYLVGTLGLVGLGLGVQKFTDRKGKK